jgi:hypothetical protein
VTLYASSRSFLSMLVVSIFRGARGNIRSMVKKRRTVSLMTGYFVLPRALVMRLSPSRGRMHRVKADHGHQITSGT